MHHEQWRALSIAQPWAELILRRRKPIEIRTWHTNYRGALLIHASRTWKARAAQELGVQKTDVVQGAFVGIAELVEVRRFTRTDAAMLKAKGGGNGWWETDQYAWVLKSVHRLDEPIQVNGKLGLFVPPDNAIKAAEKALRSARKVALKAAAGR